MSGGVSTNVRKKRIRERLSEAQNHRCAYCGGDVRETATLEHVVSKYAGGKNAQDNLVVACPGCNVRRGKINAFKFFRKITGQRT